MQEHDVKEISTVWIVVNNSFNRGDRAPAATR